MKNGQSNLLFCFFPNNGIFEIYFFEQDIFLNAKENSAAEDSLTGLDYSSEEECVACEGLLPQPPEAWSEMNALLTAANNMWPNIKRNRNVSNMGF